MKPKNHVLRLVTPSFGALFVAVALTGGSPATGATNPPAPIVAAPDAPSNAGSRRNFAELLALSNLVINPKIISPTDGGDVTIGVEYSYNSGVMHLPPIGRTDVELSVRSEGLIVVEEDKSPNRLLTHGLRLSVVNLWPSRRIEGPASDNQRRLFRHVQDNYFQDWGELADERTKAKAGSAKESLRHDMDAFFGKARAELAPYGALEGDVSRRKWYVTGLVGDTDRVEWQEKFLEKLIKPRFVFLSFDLEANAETDQTFSEVQLVGQGLLRGKILMDWLDRPFAWLRRSLSPVRPDDDGDRPVNYLNRNGGPHFWAGAGIVDPSNVEARQMLVGDENPFARAHAGVSYRTEVYSGSTAERCVSLELLWRYYHEFDAPTAIRSRDLDNTSYFKATLLFPGNYFLEYTDGKLPLDVEGASTVSVGWRYNF